MYVYIYTYIYIYIYIYTRTCTADTFRPASLVRPSALSSGADDGALNRSVTATVMHVCSNAARLNLFDTHPKR